jgi:hypothetical protein
MGSNSKKSRAGHEEELGNKVGEKCECGSKNTVWISGGGYQEADASRGLSEIDTNGQIGCMDCGRSWWD